MPMPINNAHSGENGSGVLCGAGVATTGAASITGGLAGGASVTSLTGTSRVSGG
ncbi:hypothetical protein D3C75_1258890 [compost metagenome]